MLGDYNLNALVVDDMATMRSLMKNQLNSIGVNKVAVTPSAAGATELLRKEKYNLLLLDYYLGDATDGQQLLELIRNERLTPSYAVVVMVTGEKNYGLVAQVAEHSPDAYLIKPFTAETMLSHLRPVIERKLGLRLPTRKTPGLKPIYEQLDLDRFDAVVALVDAGVSSAWLAWGGALVVGAAFAGLIGAVSLRTRGVYFIMITLAFAQMLYYLAVSLRTYGGDDGYGLYTPLEMGAWLDGAHPDVFYWVVLSIAALLFAGFSRVAHSRYGHALRGIRDNETRMLALGYPVYRLKLAGFVAAGAVAGLAGGLLASHNAYVSPSLMHWTQSVLLLVMVMLGGAGRRWGAAPAHSIRSRFVSIVRTADATAGRDAFTACGCARSFRFTRGDVIAGGHFRQRFEGQRRRVAADYCG